MSSEWEEVRLQDVTSILGDGLHGTPEYDDSGDYYFINGNNLNNGRIVVNEKNRRVSDREYQKGVGALLVIYYITNAYIRDFQHERPRSPS